MSHERELPSEFAARLHEIHGHRARQVMASFDVAKRPCLWLNPLVADPAETLEEIVDSGIELEALPWMGDAYLARPQDRGSLVHSSAFERGAIYLQNPSSLLAARLLAPHRDEEILDLAAAPGGKTIQLAAMMANRGRVAAVESVKARFFRMKANLERASVAIVVPYLMDGRAVGRKTPGRFDRVLLDAPCSSEGRFRVREPSSFRHWSMRKVRECARKQRGLLRSALQALKPQGRLLYCTCSFAPEENELVIQHALERIGETIDVVRVDVPIPNTLPGLTRWRHKALDPRLERAVRVIPDEAFDAFFLCLLEKR
ncbi:MAG: RsmB/NOP family class I SAM-dependent RNA methyltransferase [Pseudomonadales bacterium]